MYQITTKGEHNYKINEMHTWNPQNRENTYLVTMSVFVVRGTALP